MATPNQELGKLGEVLVSKKCSCPRCKKNKTLRRLPVNFKCADLICDFCGYLAQVKSTRVNNIELFPNTCLGAAWKTQKERMDAGIYFPLYFVLFFQKKVRVYYLSADLQTPELFKIRKPLSATAKRAGWQGYYYDFRELPNNAFVRIF